MSETETATYEHSFEHVESREPIADEQVERILRDAKDVADLLNIVDGAGTAVLHKMAHELYEGLRAWDRMMARRYTP